MRQKRPSVALDPAIAARARALRASGLSYRAVVAQLEAEGMRASLAAVHAACQDPAAAVAADPAALVPESADDVDTEERVDELRAVAGAVVLQVRTAVKHFAVAAAAGDISIDNTGKLLAIAERAEKLARLLEGKQARPPAPPAAAAAVVVLTDREASVVAALGDG